MAPKSTKMPLPQIIRFPAQNVEALVSDGRARWKIENENNNTLKTKGYNLEHNFGHGKKHLSSLLATFNLLAFLFHTLLDLTDQKYQLPKPAFADTQNLFRRLASNNHAISTSIAGITC